MKPTTKTREYRDGWTGRLRNYSCRVCRQKFQHDGGQVPEKARICPSCLKIPEHLATFNKAFLDLQRIPAKPAHPCGICGSKKWWLRDSGWGQPEWLCGNCHPEPKGEGNK